MLSAHQEGLWRVEQIVRGSAFQHVASVHHIRGDLDVPALERAIVLLGRRHELLHTGYRESHGELLAEPTDAVQLRTRLIASDAEAAEFLQAEHDRPFALEGEPLFRPVLVETATAFHLLLVLHHLICDAQSFSIIHGDLARLYALEAGIDDGAPPTALPMQYSELARATDAAARERAVAYWRDRLDGAQEIRFASANSSPEERTFGTISVPVSASWRDALADACSNQRSTPFLVFGAALLSVIVPRIDGTDLRLGAIFLNRMVPGADEVVGPFAEGLLLSVDVADAGDAMEVLHDRLRDALLAAIDHSALPFDDLVQNAEAAGLDREKLAPFTLSVASDPEPLELAGTVTEPAQPAAAEGDDGGGGVAIGLHVDLDLARERCVATFDEAFVPEADVRVLISEALTRVAQWDTNREEAVR